METLVQLIAVNAQSPSLRDNTADLDRLRKSLAVDLEGRMLTVPFGRMTKVARRFRSAGFKGMAVLNELPTGLELVDFLAHAPKVLPALALDLGTTHLEGALVDLLSGQTLASGHLPNAQAEFGVDILSRIHFASRDDGQARLHEAVLASINRLARILAEKAALQTVDIRAICVSGNTAMSHFFLNLDPFHLCREPYIPMVNVIDPCRACDLGLELHPAAVVWTMPGVGSYFGGDLISGIIATGLDQAEHAGMLIDVGTNAEVVLGNRDWLIACAGAAGPALEGGVARMGMQAGPGAIERVKVEGEGASVTWSTIDNGPPAGICGSGLIDLVAGLYLNRVIDARGKFRVGRSHGRLLKGKEGLAFVVVPAAETADGQPVLLEQVDLDAMMRSKSAMFAILSTLVSQVDLSFTDLDRIMVAGAFGRHIAPRQAIILGMLPDLDLKTYIAAGNTSLKGAIMILQERQARQRCLEIGRKITYIELNVNQEFMLRFSGCRFIPHTDHRLFPSVPVFS